MLGGKLFQTFMTRSAKNTDLVVLLQWCLNNLSLLLCDLHCCMVFFLLCSHLILRELGKINLINLIRKSLCTVHISRLSVTAVSC